MAATADTTTGLLDAGMVDSGSASALGAGAAGLAEADPWRHLHVLHDRWGGFLLLKSTKPAVSPNSSATTTAIHAAADDPRLRMPGISSKTSGVSVTTAGPVTGAIAPPPLMPGLTTVIGIEPGIWTEIGTLAVGGICGVNEARALERLSSTIATSSGNVRRGCHSSNPSRQTSESKLTAPDPAFERSPLSRIGPTGTP